MKAASKYEVDLGRAVANAQKLLSSRCRLMSAKGYLALLRCRNLLRLAERRRGAYTYDVHIMGGPQKETKGTKSANFCT